MGNGRTQTVAAGIVTVFAGLLLVACGSSGDSTQPSPPPTRVSTILTSHGPTAEPEAVGFHHPITGQPPAPPGVKLGEKPLTIIFTIKNELNHPSRLEVHEGPYVNDDVNSDLVPAHATGTLKTTLHTGIYQLDAENVPGQVNGELVVGPYRGG